MFFYGGQVVAEITGPAFTHWQPVKTQPVAIDRRLPRNFGYTLGDRLTVEIGIRTPLFYRLADNLLPQPGPVNDWLQLVSITPIEAPSDYDDALAVTYQLFKSVPASTELTLPPFPLHFEHQGQTLTETLPAWHFSYHPLLPPAKGDRQIEPVPEIEPTRLATRQEVRRLALLTAAMIAVLLYILWFYGKVPLLERYAGAFGKACRALKRLKQQPSSPENSREALQCFHHALNELAGETVFSTQLPAFFQRFPKFAPLQQQTEDFFKVSEQLFFSDDNGLTTALEIERLENLCLLYRKLERGCRWS